MEEDDGDVSFFIRSWAEAVLRQIEHVRKQRQKSRVDLRNNERMEEWSPSDEVLSRNFRSQWVDEHTLVWAAHQLERWTRRLAADRGEPEPVVNVVLGTVRNALEHLDEADLVDGLALPGPLGQNRSLRSLPDKSLRVALGGRGLFVDSITMDQLEERASAALAEANAAADAKEQAIVEQYLDDERRGR